MKSERYAFILIADEKYWNMLCERNSANSRIYAFVRFKNFVELEKPKKPPEAFSVLFRVSEGNT